MRALLVSVLLACTLFACERTHKAVDGDTPNAPRDQRGGGPRLPDDPMVIERPSASSPSVIPVLPGMADGGAAGAQGSGAPAR